MRDEYNIEELNPRPNPYSDILNNSQENECDFSEDQIAKENT